jgi:thioredoxin 1
MNNIILNAGNRQILAEWLANDVFLTACLCAAWCDICGIYKSKFDSLAARHPDQRFVWIDIEDHADLVGDLDIDNFPTLLMQRSNVVLFLGTVEPDLRVAERLLRAQLDRSSKEQEIKRAVSSIKCNMWLM